MDSKSQTNNGRKPMTAQESPRWAKLRALGAKYEENEDTLAAEYTDALAALSTVYQGIYVAKDRRTEAEFAEIAAEYKQKRDGVMAAHNTRRDAAYTDYRAKGAAITAEHRAKEEAN